MFDTLTSRNSQDFSQRYRNTFGFLIKDGTKKLVHIDKITDDRVFFSTKEDSDWWAVADQGVQFEFLPVNRGFYNTINGLYFVARIPARMWQRGISHNNTSIVSFKTRNWIQEHPDFNNLTDIFENEVSSQKDFSKPVALSRAFAVSRNTLYMFSEAIGTASKTAITLKSAAAMVEQEVNDALRRSGFQVDVMVEK